MIFQGLSPLRVNIRLIIWNSVFIRQFVQSEFTSKAKREMAIYSTSLFVSFMMLSMVECHQDLSSDAAFFRTRLEPAEWHYEDVEKYIPYVEKENVKLLRKMSPLKDWKSQTGKLALAKHIVYGGHKRGIQSLAKNKDFPRRQTTRQSLKEYVANYSFPSSYNNEKSQVSAKEGLR